MELFEIKAKYFNKELEENIIIKRYKNLVNAITSQCKQKGIKLSFKEIK